MSKTPNLNPQTLAVQINQIKDQMIVQKGRSDQNLAEALSGGINDIIQLITPWVTDYQVLQQKIDALQTRVDKYEPKKIETPEKETTPKPKNPKSQQ